LRFCSGLWALAEKDRQVERSEDQFVPVRHDMIAVGENPLAVQVRAVRASQVGDHQLLIPAL
jgi:hypothetical protein